MDIEETEAGTGDTVNGLDSFLVAAGVAALAVVPTYLLTIVKPAEFGSRLNPKETAQTDMAVLGPGLFFVASLPFVLLAAGLVLMGVEPPSEETVEAARQTGGAFQFGTAIGQLMNAMEDRISSGDFWSAVATALPVFAFSVLLALPLRLVGFAVSGWTTRHAMGASLYMTGGLLVGTGLVVLMATGLGHLLGSIVGSLTAFVGMLIVISVPAMQTWGFGSSFKDVKDSWLGLLAALMPIMICAILFGFALLSMGVAEPLPKAATQAEAIEAAETPG